MTDQLPADDAEDENGEDTLIVPPPGFRERLLAAQKARTSEIRQSVEIPNPMKKAEDSTPAPEQPAQEPALQPASQPALAPQAAVSMEEPAPVAEHKIQPSMEMPLPKAEDNLSAAPAKADEKPA